MTLPGFYSKKITGCCRKKIYTEARMKAGRLPRRLVRNDGDVDLYDRGDIRRDYGKVEPMDYVH